MSKPRIAINGLGRIGRLVFQLLFDKNHIDIVAINDIAPNDALVYLLKYGDEHGFDVAFFGANDKIIMILERALPKYAINIFTEEEFYKRFNIPNK